MADHASVRLLVRPNIRSVGLSLSSAAAAAVANRVVEVVCGAAKGVDLEFPEGGVRQIGKEPVDHQTAFDAALAVQDQDYLLVGGVLERLPYEDVAVADVQGAVRKVTFDETLYDVKYEASAGVLS